MEGLQFPCIYLKNGVAADSFYDAVGADGEISGSDPVKKARELRAGTETQGILVFDFSEEDADHAAAVDKIREIAAASVLPVYCAGNVNTLDDVKRLLFAGAEKVILNFVRDSNKALLEDASIRFGKKKIGVYVPDYNEYVLSRDAIEQFAGILLIDRDEDDDHKIEEETSLPVLLHSDADGVCEEVNYATQEFESAISWTDFKLNSDGLIPCVVQDYRTNAVLMVAYMNEEAFNTTIRTGRMTYWSRSRQELWTKGLTSGHLQFVKSLTLDCDNDTLLARVAQVGAACHTGHYSCFFKPLLQKDEGSGRTTDNVVDQIYRELVDRKENPREGSYATELFDRGTDQILKMIGEEASEVIIAAKNGSASETGYEIADLTYHLLALMADRNMSLEELKEELARRK